MTLRIVIENPNLKHEENIEFKKFFSKRIDRDFTKKLNILSSFYSYLYRHLGADQYIYLYDPKEKMDLNDCLKFVKEQGEELEIDGQFFERLKFKDEISDNSREAETLYIVGLMHLVFSKYRLERNQFIAALSHYEKASYFDGAAYHTKNDAMVKELEEELGLKCKQEIGRKGGKGKALKNEPQKQIVYDIWDQKPRKYRSADQCANAIYHHPELKVAARTIATWIRDYERAKKKSV